MRLLVSGQNVSSKILLKKKIKKLKNKFIIFLDFNIK